MRAPTPAAPRSTAAREWVWLGAALLAVGLLFGYSVYRDRQEIDTLERDRLQVQARVVADNLGHQLKGVSNALAGVRGDFASWDRSRLAELASPRLAALNDAMPGVRSMHILDAEGRVVATSRDPATLGRSFAQRDLFKIPRNRPDLATLYLSPPYTTQREGLLTVNAGRALIDASGAFAGVVTAALEPEYFEVVLRSVLYAPDMRTSLLHGDGFLFVSMPHVNKALAGDRSTGPTFFTRHRQSGQAASIFAGAGSLSGDHRMMALQTIDRGDPVMDRPFVVAVSRDLAALYQPWRRQATLTGGLFLLVCGASILGLLLDQRRRRTLARTAAAQDDERRDSAERLELALAGADLGLWDWYVDTNKTINDARWFTMLGYVKDDLESSLDTWRSLLHPDDAQRALAAIEAHLRGETALYELEHRLRHKDGQWIWILARGKVVQRDVDGAPVRMVGTHMDISARKAADAALSESHAFAQQVIDNLPHGFAVRDAGLRYLRWNPVLARLTGVPESAVLGRTTAEALPDMSAPLLESLMQALQRALAGEVVVMADRRIDRTDSQRWTSTVHGPLRDAAGTIVGTLSSVLDISARKHAEQQLQRSEEGLAITLQSIADAVIATDAQGRVTRMNPSAEQLTGWPAQEARGRPLNEVFRIIHAQTREPAIDPVQRVLERGEVVGLANHTALLARDGQEHQISDSAAPIRNAAGQIEGVVLVFSDVTAKYAAQQAMARSEARLRTVFEVSPECIEVIDAQGRFLDLNAAGRALYEAQSGAQLHHRRQLDFVLPEYHTDVAALLAGAMAGRTAALEYEINTLRGTRRWVESHAGPMVDDTGAQAMLIITRDITRRKDAQAKRRELNAQLQEAQKMQAIGTLAGGIAHDFNNILGAILGNAAMALEDVGRDHRAAQSLEQVNRAARRARDLVGQILAFSRRQPQRLVTQTLRPIVEEALALMRSTLPAMVRLDVELAAQPLHVHADATQIEQLLMNLCTNAWHAMQGSTGQIAVGLESVALDEAAATRLGLSAVGRYAHLSVRDSGIGMDSATRARIFEPFYTTKPSGQGTGLGLSVVHGIVSSHSGAVAVDSEPGQGSTFHVYLPLVAPPADSESAAADALQVPHASGQHVLYIDDDETMVLMVERLLQRSGYRVTTFNDAERAVAALEARPGEFALVVTDFNMPGLTGLDVARALAASHPDLPVIISSGYITDDLRSQAERLGVRRLLEKQFTIDLLAGLVHEVLAEPRH